LILSADVIYQICSVEKIQCGQSRVTSISKFEHVSKAVVDAVFLALLGRRDFRELQTQEATH
jgi:hypothetical protein